MQNNFLTSFERSQKNLELPIICFLLLVIVSPLMVAGPGKCSSESDNHYRVQVTGTAPIDNPNHVADAKKDALAKAVEQVVGMQVSERILTSKSQLVQKQIYTKVTGFVQNARPVGVAERQGGIFFQTWDVVVAAGEVNKALVENGIDVAFLYDSVARPRISIAIRDQWRETPRASWIEADSHSSQKIIDYFKRKHEGFIFKDLAMLGNGNWGTKEYVRLARKNRFDILILGKTRSSPRQHNAQTQSNPWATDGSDPMWSGDRYSFAVVAEWKIINTSTSEVIGTISERYISSPDVGGQDAYDFETARLWSSEQLLSNGMPLLFQKTLAWWNRSVFQENYEIVFHGVQGQSVSRLQEILSQTATIKSDSIHLMGVSDETAEFSVEANNSSSASISSNLKKHLGNSFVVEDIRSGRIVISAKKTAQQKDPGITLTVEGISLTNSNKLTSHLTNVSGIKSVKRVSFSGGKAKYVIRIGGDLTSGSLAEKLELYEEGRIIITDLMGRKILSTWTK